MATIFIGLGSNLGERLANLAQAIQRLPPAVCILAESPIYQTEPWGYTEQPAFLNQVIQAETNLTPHRLLSYLKKIEKKMGRQPTFRNGPRLIDLDILFYDQDIIQTMKLVIPHPFLHLRSFVLVPLADLAPDFLHPVLGKTIAELLSQIDTRGVSCYA